MLRQRSPTFLNFSAFKKTINMQLNVSATNANYNIKSNFTYLRFFNSFIPKCCICTSCNKQAIASYAIFFIRYNLSLVIKQSCIFIFSTKCHMVPYILCNKCQIFSLELFAYVQCLHHHPPYLPQSSLGYYFRIE